MYAHVYACMPFSFPYGSVRMHICIFFYIFVSEAMHVWSVWNVCAGAAFFCVGFCFRRNFMRIYTSHLLEFPLLWAICAFIYTALLLQFSFVRNILLFRNITVFQDLNMYSEIYKCTFSFVRVHKIVLS